MQSFNFLSELKIINNVFFSPKKDTIFCHYCNVFSQNCYKDFRRLKVEKQLSYSKKK